jgi:hypothetical protein
MLRLYRSFLYLYPAAYRNEFGAEMTSVFAQAKQDVREQSLLRRVSFYTREAAGLLSGAVRSHLGYALGNDWLPFRRFDMNRQFRFPRSTVFLMCVILAGVAFAIDKAQHIQANLTGAQLRTETAEPLILTFVIVYIAAAAAWGILFALRRTGMRRLDKVQ